MSGGVYGWIIDIVNVHLIMGLHFKLKQRSLPSKSRFGVTRANMSLNIEHLTNVVINFQVEGSKEE